MADSNPNKLKHLDYIQAAIARMAQNSFLFKGWAVALASGISAVGAINDRAELLFISVASATLFWGMDGYYLWIERGFVKLHNDVVRRDETCVDFNMAIDKSQAARRWLKTCFRPHLVAFYGTLIAVVVLGGLTLQGGR